MIEQILANLFRDVNKWLPGGAQLALVDPATVGGAFEAYSLSPWAGGILLLAYALLFALAGALTTIRRDIT